MLLFTVKFQQNATHYIKKTVELQLLSVTKYRI